MYDVIIIGAGASGLIAARELARAGKKVCILEARNRLGGRIHTENASGFSNLIEAGAEFIHRKLPVTFGLIEEGGIEVHPVAGTFYQVKNGQFDTASDFIEHSGVLEKKLKEVEEDISITEFIARYFQEEKYEGLRSSLKRFVEGYDAADADRMSTIAFREEWLGESWEQYRIVEGYKKVIDFLAHECKKNEVEIFLTSAVKKIAWKKDSVEVISSDGRKYSAKKILITVPLGVLLAEPEKEGAITFDPPIPKKILAARKMGYGPVIKIILEFKTRFWEKSTDNSLARNQAHGLGFVFSDEPAPTWWSQLPLPVPILTGWLAGPNAKKREHNSDDEILIEAMHAVSRIFDIDPKLLEQELLAWRVVNWLRDPYSLGAYAYATIETPEAKRELLTPEENTIYFAGEALNEGSEAGTVECALASGLAAAKKIVL